MFEYGKKYFIKTATDYFTGECVADGGDAVLKKAAWIADTGRFSDAMKTGVFSEVEPYPEEMVVTIHAGGIISSCEWPHDLPRDRK